MADSRTHEEVRHSEQNFARRLTVALEQRDKARQALTEIANLAPHTWSEQDYEEAREIALAALRDEA